MHDGCRLTRTGKGAAPRLAASRKGQGRPVGLLVSWLAQAHKPHITTAEDHKNPFLVVGIPRAERSSARSHTKTLEGGPQLLANEYAQIEGEDSEPEAVP